VELDGGRRLSFNNRLPLQIRGEERRGKGGKTKSLLKTKYDGYLFTRGGAVCRKRSVLRKKNVVDIKAGGEDRLKKGAEGSRKTSRTIASSAVNLNLGAIWGAAGRKIWVREVGDSEGRSLKLGLRREVRQKTTLVRGEGP